MVDCRVQQALQSGSTVVPVFVFWGVQVYDGGIPDIIDHALAARTLHLYTRSAGLGE